MIQPSLAKNYQYNIGEKKRYKVLARRGSYHGMTAGALSVNGAAAINRACAGLGLVYALYCDQRFASADAKFTTAFARRGLIAMSNGYV